MFQRAGPVAFKKTIGSQKGELLWDILPDGSSKTIFQLLEPRLPHNLGSYLSSEKFKRI
jgi:hypothetical protein